MKRIILRGLLLTACLVWMASFWGCAGRSYLIVDYRVPVASQQLSGNKIQLRIEDQRKTEKIMSQNAAKKFDAFKDRYSLALIMPDKERILSGEYDLSALLKTTFEKRLTLMGAEISGEGNSQTPVLTISLESFTLDLKDRKWMAQVGYRASLIKDGHPITSERIQGNAERIKVIGRKGADLVISEIFTDVVNRLDIQKLFQKAELIP